jgi:hypothetical protein
MTQEDKELLLKDLSARLPYKLICEVEYKEGGRYKTSNMFLSGVFTDEAYFTSKKGSIYSNDYKPYLLPLSSMNEEQSKIYHELIGGMFGTSALINFEALEDFFNKNHIDYRGLIPKRLALDATGKGIY